MRFVVHYHLRASACACVAYANGFTPDIYSKPIVSHIHLPLSKKFDMKSNVLFHALTTQWWSWLFFFLSAAIRPQKRPAPRKRSCENNISVCCVYSVAVHWPESDGTIYLLMMFDEHSLISNCVCTIVWYTAVRTYRRYLVYARALFVRLDSHREWGVLLCCSAHKSPLSHIADRH